jgi:hypothetical protein
MAEDAMAEDGTVDAGSARARQMAGFERVVEAGILSGVAGAVPMGLFAMVASATWLGDGLYAPAYRVALMVETTALDESMRRAAAGDLFYLSREAFAFGVALHCFVAGALGAVFALVARALRPRNLVALAGYGVLYALVVLAVMSLVVLPALGRELAPGAPLGSLADEVGLAALVAGHVLYGITLAAWPPLRAAVVRAPSRPSSP